MGKRLTREQQQNICNRLRQGQRLGEIMRATGHQCRTIRRLAEARGVPVPGREMPFGPEAQRAAGRLLRDSRLTVGDLARSFGMGRSTLKRRLRRAGVRGYGRTLRPAEIERIAVGLASGETSVAIARAMGRDVRTVERYRSRLAQPEPSGVPLAAAR